MNIYILLDDFELEAIADQFGRVLSSWLEETGVDAQLVDQRSEDASPWLLGISIETSRKAALKIPLEFLYKQSKKMEREFVIGIYDSETGEIEDVCFFGYQEGRPDMDEIGLYLGLKR